MHGSVRPDAPPWDATPAPAEPTAGYVPMTMPEGAGAPPALPPAPGPPPPPDQAAAPARGPMAPLPEPPPFVNPMVAGAPMPQSMRMVPVPGGHELSEPVGDMPQETSHMLGLSTLAVGVGGLLGHRYGGMYGAAAGALVGGALINGYRAVYYYKEGSDDGDKEAGVAATYALASGAVAAYLFAKHVEPRQQTDAQTAVANPEELPESLPLVDPTGPCAMRGVGPRVVPTAEMIEAAEVED